MSLLVEDLKNRRVVRVGVGYLLTALGLLLSIGIVSRLVPLPEWTLRMVGGIAFIALPFVLVLTWALENTGPQNLKKVGRRTT